MLSGSLVVTLEKSCESSGEVKGRDGWRKKYLSGDRSTDNLKTQKRPESRDRSSMREG